MLIGAKQRAAVELIEGRDDGAAGVQGGTVGVAGPASPLGAKYGLWRHSAPSAHSRSRSRLRRAPLFLRPRQAKAASSRKNCSDRPQRRRNRLCGPGCSGSRSVGDACGRVDDGRLSTRDEESFVELPRQGHNAFFRRDGRERAGSRTAPAQGRLYHPCRCPAACEPAAARWVAAARVQGPGPGPRHRLGPGTRAGSDRLSGQGAPAAGPGCQAGSGWRSARRCPAGWRRVPAPAGRYLCWAAGAVRPGSEHRSWWLLPGSGSGYDGVESGEILPNRRELRRVTVIPQPSRDERQVASAHLACPGRARCPGPPDSGTRRTIRPGRAMMNW